MQHQRKEKMLHLLTGLKVEEETGMRLTLSFSVLGEKQPKKDSVKA